MVHLGTERNKKLRTKIFFELSFSVADSLKVLLGNLAAGKKADGGRF